LQQEGVTAEVVEVEVTDADTARAAGFLGSPTIRIKGWTSNRRPGRRSRTG